MNYRCAIAVLESEGRITRVDNHPTGALFKMVRPMTTDTSNIKTAEAAREYAVDWQHWQSEQSLSWGEVTEWQAVFRKLAKKFGLVGEFKENGII